MNVHRNYFLRHLGIGEVWSLRHVDRVCSTDSLNEDLNFDASALNDSIPTQVLQSPMVEDGWQQLLRDIEQCNQCGLCASSLKVQWDGAVQTAETLVIFDWSENVDYEPAALTEFERLCANILKSLPVGASRYATLNLLQSAPPHMSTRIPADLSAKYCGAFVRRAIALSKAKNLIIFGARAANAVLENNLDIQQLRSSQLSFCSLPVFVTFSPFQLMLEPQIKRNTWYDLCRMQAALKT